MQTERASKSISLDMDRVGTIILGGGAGTRLYPLTMHRCKPAITFGGRYRLIDVPISNSINSGCHKIFIITQFLSSSLHQHIFRTYRHDIFSSGFVELLPAEQKPKNNNWFQGTADAVRQNIEYFIDTPVDYFLILSGDQLYNMDFRAMMRFALETDAELVVSALPITPQDAKRMGILKRNEEGFITDFIEKPQTEALLKPMASFSDTERPYLASMGIYLFKRSALFKLLEQDAREDFGKHLIPTKVAEGNAAAYVFDGYWEDIGTIQSYYEANMALTRENPLFDCYNNSQPIYSSRNNLPGPKIFDTKIKNSIICEGSIVQATEVSNSILGLRTVIKKGSIIRDSYIMGNEFYTPPIKNGRLPEELVIEENCLIEKAILDKHVHIGKGVTLVNKDKLNHYNSDDVYIRDGIIIVPRGATLPEGFIL